jgi:hypothetical protein
MLILFLGTASATTESTETVVHFNINSVIGFELTLLGETPVQSATPPAATTDIEFNSSTPSVNFTEARVVGGTVQSTGNPIFVYKNIGTQVLALNVHINATTPACIVLYGDTTYSKAGTTINTANVSVSAALAVGASVNWYMWANFTGCGVADICTRNLTSIGGA